MDPTPAEPTSSTPPLPTDAAQPPDQSTNGGMVNELGQAPLSADPNASTEQLATPQQPVAVAPPAVTETPPVATVNPVAPAVSPSQSPDLPVQTASMPGAVPAQTPPQKNNKIKIIIGVAVAVVILAIGAAFALSPKKEAKNASGSGASSGKGSSSSSSTSKKGNELTATYMSEVSAVCTGSSITNVAEYKGAAPHPIAIFEQDTIDKNSFTSSSIYFSDSSWTVDTKEYAKVQLVGCLTKKSTTATGRTCDMEDENDQKISVGLFNVVYNLAVYEAKTGKKLADKEVSGPATDCPYFATYDKEDPKLYGDPDKGSATEAVKEYVTK